MSGETTVYYSVVPLTPNTDISEILTQCHVFISTIIRDYIWQKESFNLHVMEEDGIKTLSGSTNVGENINDEWFIVYLSFELSKRFKDVIIRVTDSDGSFLLIEAAEHLPKWMKPENSDNRVFIRDGSLHIIPYPSNPAELTHFPTGTPTLQQVTEFFAPGTSSRAPREVEEAITKRMSGYPDRIQDDFHHAYCYVPEEIVYMLHNDPGLVSVAVDAFYNRDQLDVKTCKHLPSFAAERQLCSRVKFTKHLYCQLQQARFLPDRRSKWRLPSINDNLYKAKELGFKLAFGFEILLCKNRSSQSNGDPSGKQWETYLANLQKNDFFQGELEGSKRYKELLEKAKCHFKEKVNQSTDYLSQKLLSMLEEAPRFREDMKTLCENLPPEDSDEWMFVSPEELDEMMLGIWGRQQQPQTTGNNKYEKESESLTKLVDNMKLFVDKVSSYEGAEVPVDCTDDTEGVERAYKPKRRDDKNKVTNDQGEGKIQFDPQKFMESIQDLLAPPSQYQTTTLNEFDDSGHDTDSDDDDDEEIDDDFISCDPEHESNSSLGNGLQDIMQEMDNELRQTNVPKSFRDEQKNEDSNEDLNYDVNLIKNFLESFSSQDGLSGPVSNIIQSMGMSLPPNCEDNEEV